MLDVEIKTERVFDGNRNCKTFLQRRCDFFQRHQNCDEPIYIYLEVIRKLAECCSFYITEEELLIRDRLVSGLNDSDLQIKVLETFDNPTIEDVVSFCTTGVCFLDEKIENENLNVPINVKVLNEDIDDTYAQSDDNIDIDTKNESDVFSDENYANNEIDDNESRIQIEIHDEQDGIVCSFCEKKFKKQVYLYNHLIRVHPKLDPKIQSLECYLCKQPFKSIPSLNTHIAWHSRPKSYCCSQCGASFRRDDELQRHWMRADHDGVEKRKYQCEVCGKKIAQRSHYLSHRAVHQKNQPFKCTYKNCCKAYKNFRTLNKHYREHCGEFDTKQRKFAHKKGANFFTQFEKKGWTYPSCVACGKSFESLKLLRGHLVEHAIENKFTLTEINNAKNGVCVLCKTKFKSYEKLQLHYSTHIDEELPLPKIRCNINMCGELLESTSFLRKHMLTHIEELEFPCTFCDKRFKTRTKQQAHIKIHRDHAEHICDICGNIFKRKVYLDSHKERVHPVLDSNIQTIECYLCRQQFKSIASVKAHIKRHSWPKIHLCTQCGVSFRSISELERHLMRADHDDGLDRRKYQCDVCGKKIGQKHDYLNHRAVHEKDGDRPFKCTYENCFKAYKNSRGLQKHARTHLEEFG